MPNIHCGAGGLYISDTLHIMEMVNNSVKKLYNGLILCLVSDRLFGIVEEIKHRNYLRSLSSFINVPAKGRFIGCRIVPSCERCALRGEKVHHCYMRVAGRE